MKYAVKKTIAGLACCLATFFSACDGMKSTNDIRSYINNFQRTIRDAATSGDVEKLKFLCNTDRNSAFGFLKFARIGGVLYLLVKENNTQAVDAMLSTGLIDIDASGDAKQEIKDIFKKHAEESEKGQTLKRDIESVIQLAREGDSSKFGEFKESHEAIKMAIMRLADEIVPYPNNKEALKTLYGCFKDDFIQAKVMIDKYGSEASRNVIREIEENR